MQLLNINDENIESMLRQHEANGGRAINESLSKLFISLSDETNQYEVSIKVAALNQIYSTAIMYIAPVVEKIHSEIDNTHTSYSSKQYVDLVDKISTVNWTNKTASKNYSRHNLSFSSKYIHFLSGKELPIYDSYIWIIMVGYMMKKNYKPISIAPPKTYSNFYKVFCDFKAQYNLSSYSNYEIDKYLWQYGKNLITELMITNNLSADKARTKLKASIGRLSNHAV